MKKHLKILIQFLLGLSVCLFAAGNVLATSNSGIEKDAITLTPCHVKNIEAKARCASITVPENWDAPEGKTIELYAAIVPPSGGQVTKAPLYVLAGGPGQAASTLGPIVEISLKRARRGREVVLLDQRGTGKSSPFDCADNNIVFAEDLKGDDFASSCLARTHNQPQFYNSDAFMHDLDAVRKSLGHEKINLLGGSYGTRAALLYLRKYPEQVRSLILDGVAAPETAFFEQFYSNAARTLNKLFEDCAGDHDCRTTYPDLPAQFEQILQALRLAPVELQKPSNVSVTPDVFLNALRIAMYSPLATAQLPLVIDAAANGDFAPWTAIAGNMNAITQEMSIGTMLSVLCGEEIHHTSAQTIADLARDSAFEHVSMDFWFDACSVWPHQVASPDYRNPVSSDVPTLLLSGELDPVTPPAFGVTAASRLSNATHVVAPFGAHTIGSYGCVPKLIATFLDSADPSAVDSDCLSKLTREPFVLNASGPKP